MASDLAVAAVRRPPPWSGRREALVVAGAAAVAIPTGAMVGRGLAVPIFALAGLTVALLVGLTDWRRALYGLLLYLPFCGVASVLLYPNTTHAILAKDFLFVIPAYVGFLAQHVSAGRPMSFRGAPTWLLACFAALVLGQAFYPNLPGPIVAAIGAKVWLFYIPLCFLGYHLVRDRRDLHRLLGFISLAAVIPALIGIGEALLLYAGHGDLVYGAYGPAAASVTQDFARFDLAGGASLRRVPSTFTFVAQYFSFTVAMVAVAYAWWRGNPARARGAPRFGVWLLLFLAGLLSGARAAFLFLPFLMALVVVLEGRTARRSAARLLAPALLLLGLTAAVIRTTVGSVLAHATAVGVEEFGYVFVDGFRQGLARTLMGLGTGANTNAARYVLGQTDRFVGVDGTWYESWYVKALLELGVAGLVILALLFGTIVTRALRQHRGLRDPGIKAVSASLLALLLWNLVFNVKAQYLDIDPMNVYFWLFLGVLFKLPTLDEERT